jgi:hypothetical protein
MIKQRVITMLPRIFVIVAVVVILAAAVGGGPALAAKGGNGKGKALGHDNGNGNPGSTTATVFAEPNPADAGSVVHIAGCGYDAAVEVHIEHATYTEAYGVVVWASGCFDFPLTTAEPGTYVLKAFQQGKRGLILMAEGTLEVQ